MALSLSITLTIIITQFFFFLNKRLSFIQNSIVFMVMGIITTNYFTIMTMQLKMIRTTEDDFLFIFFLLYRGIIIPFLVLMFINIYLLSNSWVKKMYVFIGAITLLSGMEHLAVQFKVIEYINWNLFYNGIVDVVDLFIGLGLAKIVLFLQESENK